MSSLIKLTRTILFLEQFIMYVLCMYTIDMYLLCMIKARIRWCTCRVENILTLGKLLSLWFCFLLLSILFLISQSSYRTYKIISSYELARPVMGTIFLVNEISRNTASLPPHTFSGRLTFHRGTTNSTRSIGPQDTHPTRTDKALRLCGLN